MPSSLTGLKESQKFNQNIVKTCTFLPLLPQILLRKAPRRYSKDVTGFFFFTPQSLQSLLLCPVYISAAVMVRQFEPLPTAQGNSSHVLLDLNQRIHFPSVQSFYGVVCHNGALKKQRKCCIMHHVRENLKVWFESSQNQEINA